MLGESIDKATQLLGEEDQLGMLVVQTGSVFNWLTPFFKFNNPEAGDVIDAPIDVESQVVNDPADIGNKAED